jgi:hypothetical protein
MGVGLGLHETLRFAMTDYVIFLFIIFPWYDHTLVMVIKNVFVEYDGTSKNKKIESATKKTLG